MTEIPVTVNLAIDSTGFDAEFEKARERLFKEFCNKFGIHPVHMCYKKMRAHRLYAKKRCKKPYSRKLF